MWSVSPEKSARIQWTLCLASLLIYLFPSDVNERGLKALNIRSHTRPRWIRAEVVSTQTWLVGRSVLPAAPERVSLTKCGRYLWRLLSFLSSLCAAPWDAALFSASCPKEKLCVWGQEIESDLTQSKPYTRLCHNLSCKECWRVDFYAVWIVLGCWPRSSVCIELLLHKV